MARISSPFITIRSEGALLPPELLTRITDGAKDLGGLAPTDYHLGETERLGEAISRSWNRLVGVWASFEPSLESFSPSEPGTGVTRERWLAPLFQELGFGRLQVAKAREIEGTDYPISHEWGEVPIHLVGAGVELERRTKGVAGAAKMSPHALVQDYLNRTESLWGIVSNGRDLRLLRDNVSFTRQAFLAFDLEAMFSGEVYADFALLWLTCHQSRLELQEDKIEGCWLERWTQVAQIQGTRALNTLREGVEVAISALGAGFVAHPSNAALRDALRSGELATADYYRELLRLIYRLIFLFVAEDRALLHPEGTSEEARARYRDFYSTTRLRFMAERLRGGPHPDLWRSFVFVCSKLAADEGCAELGLPFLGSSLFSPGACPHLDEAEIANRDLLGAVRALAFTQQGPVLRQIDYRNMGSEELGSIYESLLELHPEIHHESGSFSLAMAAGNERKTTGSYYTPTSLISALLDTALDPVLDEAAAKPDAEAAILELKVLDPACGSGHFLVAAAHRIAKRLAAHRTDEPEPSPSAYRAAIRDVISRCIFGIDVNPMATELCRVSLWMEAVEPGKPLSFLEHHIVCGNSLLGTTPALLTQGIPDEAFTALEGDEKEVVKSRKKRNKEERKGQASLFGEAAPPDLVAPIAEQVAALEATSDDSPQALHAKERAWEALESSHEAAHAKLVADAWCTAFVIEKTSEAPVLTQGVLELLEKNPSGGDPKLHTAIASLADRYRFFHPHLTFPQVFRTPRPGEKPEQPIEGWSGGFDLVLGNPPWDTLSPDVKEFFARFAPEIRVLPKKDQEALVEDLTTDPEIAADWRRHRRDLFGTVHFLKTSGRYHLFAAGNLGKGDFDTYRMFVETAMRLARAAGCASQVVKAGIYNGANAQAIRQELYEHWTWSWLLGFVNTSKAWFPDVHAETRFAIYSARKREETESIRCGFGITRPPELAEALSAPIDITVASIQAQSPMAMTIPETERGMDSSIAAKMYASCPSLGEAQVGSPYRRYQREVDMGTDRDLFVDREDEGLPLYEGRMIDHYDYRAKAYVSGRGRSAIWDPLPFGSRSKVVAPQWRVPPDRIPKKVGDRYSRYRVAFCDVAPPTAARSLVATLVPPGVLCGHTAPTLSFESPYEWAYMPWLAVANSLCVDYLARKKISLHMSLIVMDSLPFPRFRQTDEFVSAVGPLALRLTCTGPEMADYWNRMSELGWGQPCSDEVPRGAVDELERANLRAEVDALVAHYVFGLEAADLEHVLDSFVGLARAEKRSFGEHRTKRLVLERLGAIARAEDTRGAYRSPLDSSAAARDVPDAAARPS